MDAIMEATRIVNVILEMLGEESVQLAEEGSMKQRLEILLNKYKEKLITKEHDHSKSRNKNDIPNMVIRYLENMIKEQA
jgi:hypothetical protein